MWKIGINIVGILILINGFFGKVVMVGVGVIIGVLFFFSGYIVNYM